LTERFLELSDFGGFFEGLFAGFGTLLLELFQLGFGFLEGAVEAMLVKREAGKEVTVPLEGFGLGEGAIDERVGGHFSFLVFFLGTAHNGFACALTSREAKEAVFHGADAIEPPIGIGDGLDAFGFEQTLRLELGVELAAVILIGCEIFRGEDDGVACEAVTKGVERYAALAIYCDGPAGMGGVLAVDFSAIDRCRRVHNKNFGSFARGVKCGTGYEAGAIEKWGNSRSGRGSLRASGLL
jgi:hypothetical protein